MLEINFPPVSNRADWKDNVQILNGDGDGSFDFTDAKAVVEVRRKKCGTTVLSATTENGKVTFPAPDVVGWVFPRDEMLCVCAGPYEIGATIFRDGETDLIFIGTVEVKDGVVSR